MSVRQKKVTVSKCPLRLMSSVRRVEENFSGKEGVSLNQFINIAVAEKLAHLQHEEWLAHRPTEYSCSRDLAQHELHRRARKTAHPAWCKSGHRSTRGH